jgi:hypothetical protein
MRLTKRQQRLRWRDARLKGPPTPLAEPANANVAVNSTPQKVHARCTRRGALQKVQDLLLQHAMHIERKSMLTVTNVHMGHILGAGKCIRPPVQQVTILVKDD